MEVEAEVEREVQRLCTMWLRRDANVVGDNIGIGRWGSSSTLGGADKGLEHFG